MLTPNMSHLHNSARVWRRRVLAWIRQKQPPNRSAPRRHLIPSLSVGRCGGCTAGCATMALLSGALGAAVPLGLT